MIYKKKERKKERERDTGKEYTEKIDEKKGKTKKVSLLKLNLFVSLAYPF